MPDKKSQFENERIELEHRKISELNSALEETQHTNKVLSYDLEQRKKMLEAKDRRIAELNRQLDKLKKQSMPVPVKAKNKHTDAAAERHAVIQAIEQWRMAWQSQDTAAYISRVSI